MRVIVTPDDLHTVVDHGTVVEMTGHTEDGSQRVTFAGDHRPMRHLVDMLGAEGDEISHVEVDVEDWQVRRVTPSPCPECGGVEAHKTDSCSIWRNTAGA